MSGTVFDWPVNFCCWGTWLLITVFTKSVHYIPFLVSWTQVHIFRVWFLLTLLTHYSDGLQNGLLWHGVLQPKCCMCLLYHACNMLYLSECSYVATQTSLSAKTNCDVRNYLVTSICAVQYFVLVGSRYAPQLIVYNPSIVSLPWECDTK